MNLHGKDIKIFTANSNPKVAAEIAKALGLPLGQSEVVTLSDGEISVSIKESVRPLHGLCSSGQKGKGKRSHFRKACC